MPRTGDLLSLSRDHHTALVLARAARIAVESADEAACAEVLARMAAHWQQVMAAHFAHEERLLALAKGALDADCVTRVASDHALLRNLIVGPCMLQPLERVRQLGELLAAHVRFEERVVFPQLQPVLAESGTSDAPDPAGTKNPSR